MKFGEKTRLKIAAMDKKGRGCGIVGGRRACVPFAIPEEEVEATLVKRKQGDLVMKLDAIITPSPHRTTPRCPYVGRCGGCAWQQFDYAHQLEMKLTLLTEALRQHGVPVDINAVTPCPELFYYRNRMDYCVGPNGELGMKEPGRWNAYLDLEECHLLSPEAVAAMAAFREYVKKHKLVPWNGFKHEGFVRYFVIREGKNTGQRMITIITSAGPSTQLGTSSELPAKEELIALLSPFATTIYHGINPTITDLSYAHELELLHGEPLLEEKVDDKTFLIHPNAFFQTNTLMAGKLLETVRDFLSDKPPKTLLDLYCGTGFFGISLAESAERVVGVELEPSAIEMARKNADLNGVKNAEFTAAKSESLVWDNPPKAAEGGIVAGKPDTVIIDPPRAGLHPKVIASLLHHLPERIVYVSCNYESFAREWQALGTAYEIKKATALDLFPHTPHVELVTLLQRKNELDS